MDPRSLIPHAGPMCWLDRVESHDARSTRCSLVVREAMPLAGAGANVPGHAALEFMAQTAAVHAVLGARESGSTARLGRVALLGTRALELSREWLEPGERLIAEAAPRAASAGGLAVFDATVHDEAGRGVASARLNLLAEANEDG